MRRLDWMHGKGLRMALVSRRAQGARRIAVLLRIWGFLLFCFSLASCSTTVQVATEKVAELALSSIGIKIPENSGLPRPPKQVAFHIEGGHDMNAFEDGQGLATVLRIYKLRDHTSFLSAPYASLGQPEKEKLVMGSDLVDTKEVILSPGQVLDLKETVPADAAYVAVATLFRSPAPQRWRFAFAVADAEKARITLGVHACAMTATSVPPVGMSLTESALLSSVTCR